MATTVTGAFSTFKSRLEVTPLQAETLSKRHQDVRKCVAEAFTVYQDFLIGSYPRDTACRPIKDVDLMVVLNWGVHGEYYIHRPPYALLSDVKKVLVTSYPLTDIRVDGQAVSMRFYDFTVDVVPGFALNSGNWIIPDSPGGTWIETNPKAHADIMTEANRKSGGMFKPLVKMIKGWNRNNGDLLKGFHIECMAQHIFTSTPDSYAQGMLDYFDQAWAILRDGVPDPINRKERVDNYLTDAQRASARQKVVAAETTAREAIKQELLGNQYTAVTLWRSLIGDPFPAWG